MTLEERACAFATAAHGAAGQKRKYTEEPYIVHPMAVAEIVRSVRHTEEMIAAAYLHDVVEDTSATSADVHGMFGHAVGNLVDWLTDVSKPTDGNRETRKSIDREHLAKAPPCAQTIKVADLIDNTRSIKAHDPNFWRVYRREKLALLNRLVLADSELLAIARLQCEG